jgi:hypothetical protein
MPGEERRRCGGVGVDEGCEERTGRGSGEG